MDVEREEAKQNGGGRLYYDICPLLPDANCGPGRYYLGDAGFNEPNEGSHIELIRNCAEYNRIPHPTRRLPLIRVSQKRLRRATAPMCKVDREGGVGECTYVISTVPPREIILT
jgi:hypothetical protein